MKEGNEYQCENDPIECQYYNVSVKRREDVQWHLMCVDRQW